MFCAILFTSFFCVIEKCIYWIFAGIRFFQYSYGCSKSWWRLVSQWSSPSDNCQLSFLEGWWNEGNMEKYCDLWCASRMEYIIKNLRGLRVLLLSDCIFFLGRCLLNCASCMNKRDTPRSFLSHMSGSLYYPTGMLLWASYSHSLEAASQYFTLNSSIKSIEIH